MKFTFTFQLDLLCWEGRRTQVDLHGQLLVSSSISCPQTQIQFQLEIFRSWDKLIFFIKIVPEAQEKKIDLWFSSLGGAWWFWQQWVTERRFRIPGPARWFILWLQGRFYVPSSAYLLDTMSKHDLLLWGWLGYLDHWIFRYFGHYLAIFHFCQREQSLASEWLWCWASFHID